MCFNIYMKLLGEATSRLGLMSHQYEEDTQLWLIFLSAHFKEAVELWTPVWIGWRWASLNLIQVKWRCWRWLWIDISSCSGLSTSATTTWLELRSKRVTSAVLLGVAQYAPGQLAPWMPLSAEVSTNSVQGQPNTEHITTIQYRGLQNHVLLFLGILHQGWDMVGKPRYSSLPRLQIITLNLAVSPLPLSGQVQTNPELADLLFSKPKNQEHTTPLSCLDSISRCWHTFSPMPPSGNCYSWFRGKRQTDRAGCHQHTNDTSFKIPWWQLATTSFRRWTSSENSLNLQDTAGYISWCWIVVPQCYFLGITSGTDLLQNSASQSQSMKPH